MSVVDEARRIMAKIDSSSVPLGLFVRKGKMQLSRVDKELFKNIFRIHPDTLIAVYDCNARLEWIVADLEAAGVK